MSDSTTAVSISSRVPPFVAGERSVWVLRHFLVGGGPSLHAVPSSPPAMAASLLRLSSDTITVDERHGWNRWVSSALVSPSRMGRKQSSISLTSGTLTFSTTAPSADMDASSRMTLCGSSVVCASASLSFGSSSESLVRRDRVTSHHSVDRSFRIKHT